MRLPQRPGRREPHVHDLQILVFIGAILEGVVERRENKAHKSLGERLSEWPLVGKSRSLSGQEERARPGWPPSVPAKCQREWLPSEHPRRLAQIQQLHWRLPPPPGATRFHQGCQLIQKVGLWHTKPRRAEDAYGQLKQVREIAH